MSFTYSQNCCVDLYRGKLVLTGPRRQAKEAFAFLLACTSWVFHPITPHQSSSFGLATAICCTSSMSMSTKRSSTCGTLWARQVCCPHLPNLCMLATTSAGPACDQVRWQVFSFDCRDWQELPGRIAGVEAFENRKVCHIRGSRHPRNVQILCLAQKRW